MGRPQKCNALGPHHSTSSTDGQQINDGIERICNEIDPNSLTAYCVRMGDEIFYYSTLALVLHALSPAGQPTSDAIGAARACMRAYQTITSVGFDNVYAWIGFCHWLVKLLHDEIQQIITVLTRCGCAASLSIHL